MAHAVTMTTCASKAEAERLAQGVIEQRLAGCVQVVKVRSFYEWQGKPTRDKEFLLLIKGPKEKFPELKEHLLAEHKYELPEIISVDVGEGHEPYLSWLSR